MSKVFKFLSVIHIKTSPYHSQTDRMVGKFNGMLKQMLRKSDIKDWDIMFPFVLFANSGTTFNNRIFTISASVCQKYQSTTRCHEGAIDYQEEDPEWVISYVLDMRQRQAQMGEVT